jgi:hypothetical protein
MVNYNRLPKATYVHVKNNHYIYRAWNIPGLRDSDYYDGSGIKQTYNLEITGRDLPPNENAVPSLREKRVGPNCTKKVMGKKAEHGFLTCDECDTVGVSENGENFCPECGLLLGRGDKTPTDDVDGQEIVRDAQAAGRYE